MNRSIYFLLPLLLASSCEASSRHDPAPDNSAKIASTGKLPKTPKTALPPPDRDAAAPDPDSGEAAADVLETYYALIADHKYREAWMLWGHQGADSAMTADAFAASFDKYASYDAQIGTPGRVDAGMSQRWVEIPVTVTGKLKDGSAFKLAGPVILHHVAREMDGVPDEDKEWRLKDSSGVKPQPAG